MSEHLEVITPAGEILFFPLDPSRGVTAIGSGAGNDLRIAAPGIPERAATLDHRQHPYALTAVANGGVVRINRRPMSPGESVALNAWDGIEIGGAVLILAEDVPGVAPTASSAGPVQPQPSAGSGVAAGVVALPATAGAAVPATAGGGLAPASLVYQPLTPTGAIERIRHDYVPIRLDVPVRMVQAGQPATWELTVTNGSPNVARCTVTVVGDLYASWIAVSDSEFPLLERESQKITITLLPPRHPSSRGGEHHFAVEVRLEDVDIFLAREPALLVIEPFYDYGVSAINPPDRNLRYSQRSADFVFSIENRGNTDVRYRV
ncbi:MAG: hypothetical protein ACRC1H_16630, partial [Caldilineaceae bacterium]